MQDGPHRRQIPWTETDAIEGICNLNEALYVKHSLEDKPQLISTPAMRLALETSLSPGRRSYARLGGNIYQQQQTTREHITVHCCVNVAGDNIPPFIIYPGCLPSNAYKLDRPPSALFGIQEKGYMD